MGQKIKFDYFYGKEADTFTFYRIPKLLFTEPMFKDLSSEAKILYGLLLDRMSLSVKNGWFDEEGRAYIYFAIEDIAELLNCGKNKAVRSLQELVDDTGVGLIEKKRQGQGKSNILYVKNFIIEEEQNVTFRDSEKEETGSECYISTFQNVKKGDSGITQNNIQEVSNWGANNNKMIYNNISDTESNPIVSAKEGYDVMREYEQLIKDNIEFDLLLERNPYDKDMLYGILDLMLETVLGKSEEVVISCNRYPAELVKSKMLKLDASHIEYVMDCMRTNTTKVKNIKKYLLAALFNATTTMGSYYQAEVQHDFPQYARAK